MRFSDPKGLKRNQASPEKKPAPSKKNKLTQAMGCDKKKQPRGK